MSSAGNEAGIVYQRLRGRADAYRDVADRIGNWGTISSAVGLVLVVIGFSVNLMFTFLGFALIGVGLASGTLWTYCNKKAIRMIELMLE